MAIQNPYSASNSNLGAVVTLTAASAGVNSADLVNPVQRGVRIGINVTAISGTSPTLTVTIQGKDVASGVYYTILASAAITATGFTSLVVYPGITLVANETADGPLPNTWRISTAIGGTTPSVTATITASMQA